MLTPREQPRRISRIVHPSQADGPHSTAVLVRGIPVMSRSALLLGRGSSTTLEYVVIGRAALAASACRSPFVKTPLSAPWWVHQHSGPPINIGLRTTPTRSPDLHKRCSPHDPLFLDPQPVSTRRELAATPSSRKAALSMAHFVLVE
jgi:hypothetical protein